MDHVLYFLADPSRAALRAAEEALEQTARRVSPRRSYTAINANSPDPATINSIRRDVDIGVRSRN